MKISCEIIKDLLPLYHDGVCSNESNAMVEEHIADCENCRNELHEMDTDILIAKQEQNLSEAETVKKLSKRWKNGMFKSLLKGILFTLLTFFIFLLILYCFVGIRLA